MFDWLRSRRDRPVELSSAAIEFLGPLAAAVLGSRRWSDLAWVALAATGIWLLVGGGFEADDLVGVAAAACAGACWFAFILVGFYCLYQGTMNTIRALSDRPTHYELSIPFVR